MAKLPAYLHIGPGKTGTSSIQWSLRQNRDELLRRGFLVPDSGAPHGGHHAIVRLMCGRPVAKHLQFTLDRLRQDLTDTRPSAVILSSESISGLLLESPSEFFAAVASLNLAPRIVLFVRNQPQWLNSRYVQSVQTFRRSGPFESFVRERLKRMDNLLYSPWLDVAARHVADVIAIPFSRDTLRHGAVPAFLSAVGADPSGLADLDARRNESIGAFGVALARRVLRQLGGPKPNRMQSVQCERALKAYLANSGLADDGYCGLTTELAHQIETVCRPDNDAFARRVWGRGWDDVFAGETGRGFALNDYALVKPAAEIETRLDAATGDMTGMVRQILSDQKLSVADDWNQF